MDEILRCAQNDGVTAKAKGERQKAKATAPTLRKKREGWGTRKGKVESNIRRQMAQLKLAATDANTSWRTRLRLGDFWIGGKAVAEPPHSKGLAADDW